MRAYCLFPEEVKLEMKRVINLLNRDQNGCYFGFNEDRSWFFHDPEACFMFSNLAGMKVYRNEFFNRSLKARRLFNRFEKLISKFEEL